MSPRPAAAIALALALAASSGSADETAPLFDPADWDLLPLDELERARIQRDQRELVDAIRGLSRKIDEARGALEKRADPGDEESKRLRESIEGLRARLAPHVLGAVEALGEYGVDEAVLARIRIAPHGTNRVPRYAHALVVDAAGDEERRLLGPLVAAVDGAELALTARRQRAERSAGDEEARRAARPALEDLEAHRREIERRLWLVVDCVLSDRGKISVRRMLPGEFDRYSDPLGHASRLPGMTPAQAARLHALAAELESESAADQAEEKRLAAKLREEGLEAQARQAASRDLQAARSRLLDLRWEVARSVKALLTPEQLAAFQAIPPFVGPGDRNLRPEALVQGLRLSHEQRLQGAELAREVAQRRLEFEAELREIRKLAEGSGPDAPQQQMAQLMTLALQGEGQAELRAFARRFYLEILTPDQVADWVLGIEEK